MKVPLNSHLLFYVFLFGALGISCVDGGNISDHDHHHHHSQQKKVTRKCPILTFPYSSDVEDAVETANRRLLCRHLALAVGLRTTNTFVCSVWDYLHDTNTIGLEISRGLAAEWAVETEVRQSDVINNVCLHLCTNYDESTVLETVGDFIKAAVCWIHRLAFSAITAKEHAILMFTREGDVPDELNIPIDKLTNATYRLSTMWHTQKEVNLTALERRIVVGQVEQGVRLICDLVQSFKLNVTASKAASMTFKPEGCIPLPPADILISNKTPCICWTEANSRITPPQLLQQMGAQAPSVFLPPEHPWLHNYPSWLLFVKFYPSEG